ncbi:hypothetical protein [Kitasatospora sp. NPDC057541]|uniref:hypothetical protein n=1 Tax=unclassified Kitasatospora TaxID=2633591 RepID=UPI0036ABB0E4
MDTPNGPRDTQGLSDTFERAMGGVGAELGPLIAGATEHGRRIRRRRRATMAGAVATVAVLTVGGTLGLHSGDRPGVAPAAGGAFPAPLPKPTSGPEQQRPGTGANADKVAMTGRATVHALLQILPPGATTSGYSGRSAVITSTIRYADHAFLSGPDLPSVNSSGSVLYDDGNGPATVTVTMVGGYGSLHVRLTPQPDSDKSRISVLPSQPDSDNGSIGALATSQPGSDQDLLTTFFDNRYSCAKANATNQYQYCSDAALPDGSRLLITELAQGERLFRTADLLRPDGTQVLVNVNNTAMVAGADTPEQIRSGLPLTLDQVKAIAMDGRFQEWITPAAAQQAEQAVQPYYNEDPGPGTPSAPAGAPSAPTGVPTPVR